MLWIGDPSPCVDPPAQHYRRARLEGGKVTGRRRVDAGAELRGGGPRRAVALALVVAVVTSACALPVTIPRAAPRPGTAPTSGSTAGTGSGQVPAAPAAIECDQPAGGDAFSAAAPDDVLIDSAAVRAAIGDLSMITARSVRIYRHDCLVGTSGVDWANDSTPYEIWSMTKSVLAMLVGVAVTQGHLSLDDTVGQHLPEATGQHAQITLRQLLTQTSGLTFAWANTVAAVEGDSVSHVLGLPFDHQPGTFFEYAQNPLQLVGLMVERATGTDLQDFAQTALFDPLGIPRSRWAWQRDGAGHTLGFAGLQMASVDLARLGSLLLHGGAWRGQRIIAEDYVRKMGTPTETNPGYGFLTWTNQGETYISASALARRRIHHRWIPAGPHDLMGISGLFDQELWVIPSLDVVVVRTGNPAPVGWKHEFLRRLLRGVQDVPFTDPGPAPLDDGLDLSDFSRLIDLNTWPAR